jgi:hypothetical protein
VQLIPNPAVREPHFEEQQVNTIQQLLLEIDKQAGELATVA